VNVLRMAVGAAGVAMVVVGLVFLADDGLGDLADVVVWLAGGVVLHDGVLAPLVVVVGVLVVLRLRPVVRRPAIVGLVVLGSVTLGAVPVLGRFGAKPDDPGLLDRPYALLWLVLAGLVAVGVAAAALLRRHREEE
jgi:hypothetical protein